MDVFENVTKSDSHWRFIVFFEITWGSGVLYWISRFYVTLRNASTQFLNPRCAIITLRGKDRKRLLIELDRFGVAKICITCHVECNLDGRQHAKKSEVVVANSTLLWSLKPSAREFPTAAASSKLKRTVIIHAVFRHPENVSLMCGAERRGRRNTTSDGYRRSLLSLTQDVFHYENPHVSLYGLYVACKLIKALATKRLEYVARRTTSSLMLTQHLRCTYLRMFF